LIKPTHIKCYEEDLKNIEFIGKKYFVIQTIINELHIYVGGASGKFGTF